MYQPLFEPGEIIKVPQYEFQDGGQPKDKYLIVLAKNEDTDTVIIHSLTTSVNKNGFPTNKYGCCGSAVKYYSFPEKEIIDTVSGFCFDVPTLIFFNQNVREEKVSNIKSMGKTTIWSATRMGKLPDAKLGQLLKCIISSGQAPLRLEGQLKEVKKAMK